MTSPPTITEVMATMATTQLNDNHPPKVSLTADVPPVPETLAPVASEREDTGTMPLDEHKGKENAREDAGETQPFQDLAPAEEAVLVASDDDQLSNAVASIQEQQVMQELSQQEPVRPEDVSIPQLNQDSIPEEFVLPDQAQIAGLDALIAMGQMSQIGYHPNLALAQAAGLNVPMLPMPIQNNDWLSQGDYAPDVNRPEDRLVGYAKLVFDDGEFYMNTHSVILGRDPAAHRAAQRREKDEAKRKIDAETSGPRTPVQIKREHMSYSRSVFSERSGILREGNDEDEETREKRRQRRKASKKSKSTGSSYEFSQRNSLAQQPIKPHIYEAQYPARIKEENAVPVDPASLRPDPNECPLIPLHPSGSAPASAYKSISREHVKIAYNFNNATFEMHVYGRNGAFVDDVYHPQNSTVELKSGNYLQIGQVPLEFILPDGIIDNGQVQYDELAVDHRSVGGKEMSFDFEEDKRIGVPDESSPEPESDDEDENQDDLDIGQDGEESEVEGDDSQEMSEEQDQSGLLEEGEEDEVEEEEQEIHLESVAPTGKKRGPGRPPKNGIMSAREEREQKAALKVSLGNPKTQKSQKSLAQATLIALPEKKKVGRPRKHDKPDPAEPDKPKRKYTKRKPKEPKDGDTKQEGSDGEERPAKEKKEKKPKPPRSPTPTFIESELTTEQLQKPQANYVQLIHEALINSKEGKLGLPQIYRAIQRKYPFFVLKVGTVGWQSSVRHNLSQHSAFQKIEKDGKGWLWGIVPGSSIEKEKKRRTPPPPQMGMHQPIYQAGQQPYIGGYPQHYGPHLGYMPPPMMHGPPQPGYSQQYMGPPPMSVHPLSFNSQPPPQLPKERLDPTKITGGNRSYSSPYATTPAPAPPAESQHAEQQTPNEQAQPSRPGPRVEISGQQVQPQAQALQNQLSSTKEISEAPSSVTTPQIQSSQVPPPLIDLEQPQPPASNHMPELPQHSQKVLEATELFKQNMLQLFKKEQIVDPEREEILNSAVNRVLGYTHESSIPDNKHEDGMMKALRNFLEKAIPEFNISSSSALPSNPDRASTPQTNGKQQSQGATTQSEPQSIATLTSQPSKMNGSDKPTPTITRPTFTGQGQRRPTVSRPSMGPPRANSRSPAQSGSEIGQAAGQKRLLEDADDYRDVKRLNMSGMSPLKT